MFTYVLKRDFEIRSAYIWDFQEQGNGGIFKIWYALSKYPHFTSYNANQLWRRVTSFTSFSLKPEIISLCRTILNYMESWLLLYGLITLTIIDLIQVIRMVFGPLSEYVCWIEIFWRNGPTQGAILCLDVIIVFRVILPLICHKFCNLTMYKVSLTLVNQLGSESFINFGHNIILLSIFFFMKICYKFCDISMYKVSFT